MGMLQRVRNRWKRDAVSAEIDEELAAHLAMAEEDGLRAGMTAAEARRAARVRFGNVDRMLERVSAADVALPCDGWGTALRATLRGLRRSPGFAAAVVLTLALGIGATTALFTLIYDAMLRPLPFTHPDRLVTIQEKVAEWSSLYPTVPVSANHFTLWQEDNRSFSALALMQEFQLPMGASGRPMQVGVLNATAGLFAVLDVKPRIGRAFTARDAEPGRDHVVVLTDALWRDSFNADKAVLGRTMRLDGFPYTVIGVMPQSFHMPSIGNIDSLDSVRLPPLGVITPLVFSKERLAEQMGDLNYFGLGRLKPGVSVAAATADLDALQHAIAASLPPDLKATLSVAVVPFKRALTSSDQTPLLVLLVSVVGLLLVGCVNIANLLLARSVGRRQQMALVCALGAGRAAMLRIALRETCVLAVMGGLLGIGLAAMLVPWMQQFLPPVLNYRGTLHLDWSGAGCALLLALTAMLVAGGVSAWKSARIAPQEVLHSDARLATEARGSRQARRVLVGIEAAMSVALLIMTGLLATSVEKLLHVDRGFSVDRTMTATLQLPATQYQSDQRRALFYRELVSKLQALPGVEHAALTNVLPLTGDSGSNNVQLPGDTQSVTRAPMASFHWISPDYLNTLSLPLLSGRFLAADDWQRRVAVISEKTAETLWHGQNPIGRMLYRAGDKSDSFTVIGVVGDARSVLLQKPDPMMIYVPYWCGSDREAGLVVRARRNPVAMADSIRKTIWSIDPNVPVPTMRTLGALVADSAADQRFERDLLILFAATALLLAGLGVYGVVSYAVAQRHREIGLRLALGASRSSVYRLVLRDGLPPIFLGTLAGITIAFAMTRIMGALLFEVSPYDPPVALAASCVLVAVGTAACLLPARKAAAVDPMQALRAD